MPQGSVLDLNIYKKFGKCIESTLRNFVDDTKQEEEVDALEERATMQRPLKKTEN